MTTPPDFRFRHPVQIRFRDIDIGGHAHHSQALVYFEEARAAYWSEVAGRTEALDVDYILAEMEVRYHARILYPGRITVGVRVPRIGRKHFEMEYEGRSDEGEKLVSGRSVQVMYDYDAGRSRPLPDELRDRLRSFEGDGLREGARRPRGGRGRSPG